jgi:phytoene dehydrogenase-like protein
MSDVAVVGAGLAGLSAALHLHDAGLEPIVLEASDGVGGRVRTDEVDGFLIDRGFQVYLTGYREGRRVLDPTALDLRRFRPGASVWLDGRFHTVGDPLRIPSTLASTLRAPIGSLMDKLRIARLRMRLGGGDPARFLAEDDDTTTAEALEAEGFGDRMVQSFLRPLLAGMLLDPDLRVAAPHFRFVLAALTAGDAAVPAAGMGAIPAQLAARLPAGTIHLDSPVAAVDGGGVELEEGGRIGVSAVVVATDGPAAAALTGGNDPGSRPVAAHWYAADDPPRRGSLLMLDPGPGLVSNVAVMSEVAPGYAPAGNALVVVQCLGSAPEPAVRDRLTDLFGLQAVGWRHLSAQAIPHAHPDQRPPYLARRRIRVRPGLYLAGDHIGGASIEGALRSGRGAAEAVVADLGGDTPR